MQSVFVIYCNTKSTICNFHEIGYYFSVSLYRKYRPQKFADVFGQDHVTLTLTNALSGESFSHAYLFSGPKGSGKRQRRDF